jgi:ABC-2 type transport system permease protein
MNIYLYETRKQLLSTFWWILALSFFIWACMAFFETFANDSMTAILDEFPEPMKRAFGLNTDFSKILGYFAFISVFVFLCGAIFACNLGLNAVSVEERDLTADFLVSKPITRNKILTAKLLSGQTHLILFIVVIGVVCFGSIEAYKGDQSYSREALLLVFIGLSIFQLLFFALGLFISMVVKRLDSPLPFSLGFSFGLYMIDAFDTLLEDTILRFFIPYDYFEIGFIVDKVALKTHGVVISLVLIAIFTTGSYFLYNRRNIQTAM